MNKRLFSGIKPSGDLHIGNYLGSIHQWLKLQDEHDSVFSIMDLHAITVPQNPEDIRRRTLEFAKIYLASGIDPKKSMIFVQSSVPEHTDLQWILNTVARVGDLTKMTQLKDKAGLVDDEIIMESFDEFGRTESSRDVVSAIENMVSTDAAKTAKFVATQTILKFLKERYINPLNVAGVGLFDYPVLMAADILLYDTAVVPVGEDQVQHVELARTLARRFNDRFGETFVIPEARVMREGGRIMALDDPTKKMSKSAASEYNYIALSDDPEKAKKKIMKAVTDSGTEITYQDDRPALKNLITIYSLLGDKSTDEIVAMYAGKGYADFKRDLAEVVASFLSGFQKRFAAISDEEAMAILRTGAEKARAVAGEKMRIVKEKVGFLG